MTSSLGEQVSAFFRRHGLVGARLVVAVSGGPDSVCLLHLLSGKKNELCLDLHVAHLDHGLRDDSAADAEYVAELARGLGLPVTVGHGDVQGYRREKQLGTEEAAREVRYRFLADVAGKMGTKYITTGHTRSDHAETILLHIIRGTGIRGLTGLKPLTPWTLDGFEVALVRPLLDAGRQETMDYCRSFDLQPRSDITNSSLVPLRNRVRLELLPQLKTYNPGVENSLVRLAAAADGDIKYLDEQVSSSWDKIVLNETGAITLDKVALLSLPDALKSHLSRRCLEYLLGSAKDIEMRHVEYIMSSLYLPAGRRIDLPYDLNFVVGYDRYWLGSEEAIPSPFPAIDSEYPLAIPGITSIPGWRVEASVVDYRMPQNAGDLVSYFDFDRVGEEISVRTWRRGDRFVPLGMDKEKKLAEFMISEKIPRHWRKSIPLVVSPRQVIWLAGYRLDDRVKVTDKTVRVLRLDFKRNYNVAR